MAKEVSRWTSVTTRKCHHNCSRNSSTRIVSPPGTEGKRISTEPLTVSSAVSPEIVEAARCDLAATLRIAALENLHEGIDNHFSYALGDGTFLVNRWGVHWSRICRRDIVRIDHAGNVVDGEGEVEVSAFHIHEAVHRLCPHATVVLHTHMPYTTALACTKEGFHETLSQSALMFYKRVSYEDFGGVADSFDEGERLASGIGDCTVSIMKNHGVMVLGRTPGIAIHDLYFLERAARLQILAQNSRQSLVAVPNDMHERTKEQLERLDAEKETYFEAMKEVLESLEPDFRD